MTRIATWLAALVAVCILPVFGQRFVKIGVTTNELVTLNPYDLNNVVLVRGYASTNDSDGALFQFILGDTTPANGVDIFAPTNNAGRWRMVRTATHQLGSQFMGGGTNAITLTNDLSLTSLTVNSNTYLTNLSVFQSFTNITDNTYISTTNYTLISTNINLYSTNITILTNTYFSFSNTNYVINLFPGGGTNTVATETFVTNTILTFVVGTNLYYVFDPTQFDVAGGTNVTIVDGVALTNAAVQGMIVNDLLINGDWAIMTNGVNDIQWHRDALVTSYPELDATYSFDQLTLSNRRPTSIIRQLDFTNIVDKMFDRTQFDIMPGWTNDATLVTPWTNWMVTVKQGAAVTNLSVYGSLDIRDGTVIYTYGTAAMQVDEANFFITDGVSKDWNFKTTADAETIARIGDLNTMGYQRMMEEGVNLTQRTNVNFSGLGLTVSDDAGNARTLVQVHTNLDLLTALSSATNGFIMFNGVTPSATLRQLQAGGGITLSDGGGASGNPIISQTASSTIQLVQVDKNSGGVVGTRGQLNFIEGGGIALTITDDAGNGEVDIQIDNTGNLYNFDTTQFNAASVTNITIKNNPAITNLTLFQDTSTDISITNVSGGGGIDIDAIGSDRSGLITHGLSNFVVGMYAPGGLYSPLLIHTNGLASSVEGLEIGLASRPSVAVRNGLFGWSLVSRTGGTGNREGTTLYDATSGAISEQIPVASSWDESIRVFTKSDTSANTVTVGPASGYVNRSPTGVVLSNALQSVILQSDGDTNWFILASHNPDNATTVQVTNIVTAIVPSLVTDNSTKRVQTLIVKGSGTTIDSIGDSPNAIGGAVAVTPTSTTGYMNNYPTAASAFDPDGVYGNGIVNTAHDPHMTAFVRCPNNTDVTYWVGFGRGSQAQFATNALPSDVLSADYAAFRFCTIAGDATWQAMTGDGATDGATDTGVALDTSNTIKLEIISSSDGTSFEFLINGTSVATRTTLLPSTANLFYFIASVSSTAAATAKSISFSRSVVSLDE